MKITIFTSNNTRHNYLINLLANCCDELFVIQECLTNFPGKTESHYTKSIVIEKYFLSVQQAQKKIFKNNFIRFNKNCKINYLSMQMGDLSFYNLNSLKKFLESDLYLVFGSSFIRGELINFLLRKKAINIHAGISPFYRGCDCNFWALYEKNYHLVGSTIHFLTKGLDSGPILYHAVSEYYNDPFIYSMSTIKSAFFSIAKNIKNKEIFKFKAFAQNKSSQIRYSKKNEFNDKAVKNFLKRFKKSNIINCNLRRDNLIKPYILPKKYFFKDWNIKNNIWLQPQLIGKFYGFIRGLDYKNDFYYLRQSEDMYSSLRIRRDKNNPIMCNAGIYIFDSTNKLQKKFFQFVM